MITYHEENASTIPGRLMALFQAHGEEVIGDGYNLHLVVFSRAIDNHALRFYTAKDGEKIIGYCVYNVGNDLMRAHVRTADCHAIYVMPAYRGKVSVRLIRFSEQCLIAEGCKAILGHSRPTAPHITKLYEHLGYKHHDILLRKEV